MTKKKSQEEKSSSPTNFSLAPNACRRSQRKRHSSQVATPHRRETQISRNDHQGLKETFSSDYPKAIATVYGLVSETIRKDLTRAVGNSVPTITNNEAKYHRIRKRLQDNKWGPNSQKDAEELRRKLTKIPADWTSISSPLTTSSKFWRRQENEIP
jgi:hypothetical protein